MTLNDKLRQELRYFRVDTEAYLADVEDLYSLSEVQQMDAIPHHRGVDCLEHSIRVSVHSYNICKRLGLDARTAARGAILHDLFLYDWSKVRPKEGLHGFVHPGIALRNAKRITQVTKREEDIILKHMFPLTIKPPVYFESMIVCLVDKYIAAIELFGLTRKNLLGARQY